MDKSIDRLNKIILTCVIPVSWLTTICLAWSFLVRDFRVPFPINPSTRIFLVSIFICAVHFLYRKQQISVRITGAHLIWVACSFMLVIFLNRNTFTASLAGDELYHSDHSLLGLKIVELTAARFPGWTWVHQRPVPEIISYLNILLLGTGLLGFGVCVLLRKKFSSIVNLLGILVSLICLGFLCVDLPNRVEMHPPLRLLPLFLSQLFFGFDDVSFRLAGILSFAFLMGYLGIFVSKRTGNVLAGTLAILSISSIPAVGHVVGIVEPSIWALCCWIGSYLILDPNAVPDESHDRHERLVKCGLWIGCAALARQTSLVLWPLLVCYLLLWRSGWRIWIFSLFPASFMIPVLYTMKEAHHPAANGSPVENVLNSLTTGAGPQALLNSLTPVWIGILFGLIIYAIAESRARKIWPYLLNFVPSYILYFAIWPYLWGIGRYHAEFLGGLISILLIHFFCQASRSLVLKSFVPVLAILFYGSFTLSTLNQDANYLIWPQRRITTESVYPYRESLGFLKRQDSAGKFVFLGAVPVYGELFLYLRGFNISEVQTFRVIQQNFAAQMGQIQNLQDFKSTLTRIGASWLVVQFGEKREKQHRSEVQSKLLQILETNNWEGNQLLNHKPYTFMGGYEGSIDLYPLDGQSVY